MSVTQLLRLAYSIDDLEVRVGKALAPTLTEEELDAVSEWGRAGQGVGQKVTPQMIDELAEIGKKLPKKKVPTLYRGMCFPDGMIYGKADYSTGMAVPPQGYVEHPAGFYFRDDPAFYKKITSGTRSWSTKITNAKYYSGHNPKNRDWRTPDCLIVKWVNPPPEAIVLDTRVLTGLGYSLATDTDEILADSSGARVEGLSWDKFLLLTIQG